MISTPSQYQKDIFTHVEHGKDHIIVDAVAGSGKTSTIIAALELVPIESRTLFVAFNKHIADELKSRVPFNCEATTLNSFGFRVLRKRGFCKLNENKTENILWFEIFKENNRSKYYKSLRAVKMLVSLFKAYNITDPNFEDCNFLSDRYDILTDGDNGEYDLAMQAHRIGLDKKTVIDFDDQIFLPLAYNLELPKYDVIFVDESQDLNPAQIELVKRAIEPEGMIVAVGDSRQAIYGFRGADPQAMENMAIAMKMKKLPLSICYRCARNIVIEAQREVPHIEFSETAMEGVVKNISNMQYDTMIAPGDFVLCRTTAPLVEEALRLIGMKRKAHVRGRDFGQNLERLLEYIDDLDSYEQQIAQSMKRKPLLLMMMQDQIETMRVLINMVGNDRHAIKNAISEIFEAQGDGVMFSTIHRAKGLETNRVFLLRPDLVPHPKASQEWMIEQEHNLKYIAVTRAKEEFYYVAPKSDFEDVLFETFENEEY